MDIYLFRHGIAIDREDPMCPPDDADRALTDRGKTRTHAAAAGFVKLNLTPDVVFTSPYVRARQTAKILLRALRVPTVELIVTDALVPEAPPSALRKLLKGLSADAVGCVGHAPHLDRFLATYLGVRQPFTSLKKAGLAHLGRDDQGQPCLTGLYGPRALRHVGK